MIKGHWQKLTQEFLGDVESGEALSLGLSGEDSLFLRFNNSRLRQSTTLEQYFLEITYQKNSRQVQMSFSLSGNLVADLETARSLLFRCREEVKALPEDPFVVAFQNHGTSDTYIEARLPEARQAIEDIVSAHQGYDHAGFYCGGPLYRASVNSVGQNHWFQSDSFFYDYSLFTKNSDGANKAVKDCYSEKGWDAQNLRSQIERNIQLLQPLGRKNKVLTPGSYRAYLTPAAVNEICGILSWGAFNFASFKQGKSPFNLLADGKASFSPLLNLGENFELGLNPRFNSLGELAPTHLPVIESGRLSNWLVTTRAAKEYGVPSNASEGGMLRSLEILPGSMPQADALKELGTGVYLGNLHYLNWSDVPNARVTGMTRYACFWVENGEIVAPIQDMRFDESLFRILGSELVALTKESSTDPVTMTYERRSGGGSRIPGALLKEFTFTL